jgi:cytochrome P450
METLRLFPAVPMIPKYVEDKPQILSYKNDTFTLPPQTRIALSACALHRNPHVWGADADKFRPERWLADDSKSLRPEPVEGSFVGFSRGARRCLGRRFAEVEYTAVLSEILRNCRIELAPEKPGETMEEMSLKVKKMLEMSNIDFTMHVGGRVLLRFVERF